MPGKAFAALGVLVVAVLGVAALAAFFSSRDDATIVGPDGPGVARPASAQPTVKPGNVVLLYSDERLTSDLRALAQRTAGAPGPALQAAGQAVLVERRPGVASPVLALSSTRQLAAGGPDDQALEAFIEHWLGRTP